MNYKDKMCLQYCCWYRRDITFRFRYEPVVGTGKHFRLRKSLRYPKTQQERRLNYRDFDFVRGSRHPHHLPTVWEDIWKCTDPTWKRHRKKQWKKIENIETHWK